MCRYLTLVSPLFHAELKMDTTGIANLASGLAASLVSDNVGVAVLRKALDIEAANAAALVQALPPAPSINLPAHLGQNIDTTA